MGRVLYLQCDNGISGDMVVGALLDAGASSEGLMEAMRSLDLGGYEIRISKKMAGAFAGSDFDVVVDDEHENHDHDMEWLFGDHDHAHHHDHGHHAHEHRNLADIRHIVEHAELAPVVEQTALDVFAIIAQAEAKAHGETPDTVHFHEVGAVDSIVDVVASAWCLDDLGVDEVVVSPMAEGEGTIRSAHGLLSIPVPAVANIAEEHGLILRSNHRQGEFVTPTGAAIAAAVRSRDDLPETYRIIATGIGCGKRAYDPPSTLRVTLMEELREEASAQGHGPQLWKLETEVDDCTGEALGYVLDRLYDEGALEAHFLPVFMKKGRPGYQIEVICVEDSVAALEDVLFADTTTIGVRRFPMERTALVRDAVEVDTSLGTVRGKHVVLPDGSERTYYEHDSVAEIARKRDMGYQDVLRALRRG